MQLSDKYGHDKAFSSPSRWRSFLPYIHSSLHGSQKRKMILPPINRTSLAPLQSMKDTKNLHEQPSQTWLWTLGEMAYLLNDQTSYWIAAVLSNSLWNDPKIIVSQRSNVMKFKTDTVHTQRLANLYGRATDLLCLVSQQWYVISQIAKFGYLT